MQTLFNNMNEDLKQLSNWFKTNKLSLNIGKTNYIIFTLKQTTGHDELKLQIDNTQIQRVHSTQFLGIHIDSKLQWQEHVKHVKKKLSSGLYPLNSSKNTLQQSHMQTLYYSLVHPHLNYGCLLCDKTYKTHIHQLEVLQRKAIGVITNSKYNTSSSQLFKKNKNT